jgi:hypothetical protein
LSDAIRDHRYRGYGPLYDFMFPLQRLRAFERVHLPAPSSCRCCEESDFSTAPRASGWYVPAGDRDVTASPFQSLIGINAIVIHELLFTEAFSRGFIGSLGTRCWLISPTSSVASDIRIFPAGQDEGRAYD